MIKQGEVREKKWYEVEDEKSYELRLLEAEIELACLQWEFGIIIPTEVKND